MVAFIWRFKKIEIAPVINTQEKNKFFHRKINFDQISIKLKI